MIWDDHDIFDGWGSYPPKLQYSDVFQTIFDRAEFFYNLFQVRAGRRAGREPINGC